MVNDLRVIPKAADQTSSPPPSPPAPPPAEEQEETGLKLLQPSSDTEPRGQGLARGREAAQPARAVLSEAATTLHRLPGWAPRITVLQSHMCWTQGSGP